jgi:hypothetical protein
MEISWPSFAVIIKGIANMQQVSKSNLTENNENKKMERMNE